MTTPLTDTEAQHAAPPSAGATLRMAREKERLSLQDVADATRISLVNLQAIERADYDRLPADTYTRGFVRLYAEYIGLDGPDLAERFLQERGHSHRACLNTNFLSSDWLHVRKLAEPTRLTPVASALILLAFIVFVVSIFCLYTGWNPFSYFVHKVRTIPASSTLAYHPAHPQTSAAATTKALHLEVHFLKDTEIILQLDGDSVSKETFVKESKVNWEANSSIRIEFVEPHSAELRVNGQPLGFPTQANGQYKLSLRAAPSAS
ncbi:MAG: helix-turn-helix domain-containing protein [Desulfobulbaceae bacterium]|nr:helix-turn-helix domain-containing protein [Desulfobulbaceae bacterium]